MSNTLWMDEFGPTMESDFYGNFNAIMAFKKWLKDSTNKGRAVIVWGPTGCGKTSMVQMLMENYNIHEISFINTKSPKMFKD